MFSKPQYILKLSVNISNVLNENLHGELGTSKIQSHADGGFRKNTEDDSKTQWLKFDREKFIFDN